MHQGLMGLEVPLHYAYRYNIFAICKIIALALYDDMA